MKMQRRFLPIWILTGLLAFAFLPSTAMAKKCGCYDLHSLCSKLGGKARGFARYGLFCVIKKQPAHAVGTLSYRMQSFPKDCGMFNKKLNSNLGKLIKSKGLTCGKSKGKFSGWYRLKTRFRGAKECLEGNQSRSRVHKGAAFMDRCKNVSGQLWQFIPAGKGWYRLKTRFRGVKECLEGNQAKSRVHSGAAFMDRCKNVTGQFWQFIPAGKGWYRLKTRFRGAGECLEGNQSRSRVHSGAAFMDRCRNVTGQLWRFVKAR